MSLKIRPDDVYWSYLVQDKVHYLSVVNTIKKPSGCINPLTTVYFSSTIYHSGPTDPNRII